MTLTLNISSSKFDIALSREWTADWHATKGMGVDHPWPCVHDSLLWRHNGCDDVSNHQPHECLANRSFMPDQRKHQRSASLAFVRGIHRGPVNSPHKWPVTRKMFPFDDVIMWDLCVTMVVVPDSERGATSDMGVPPTHPNIVSMPYKTDRVKSALP